MRKIKRRTKPKKITVTSFPHLGELDAPIMLILDPVVGNTNATMPLNKNQMKWFVNHLTRFGKFKKEDVCIISCAPPVSHDTWGLGRLIGAHLKEHRDELLTLIERNKPKFVIPCGAKAAQQVIGRAVQITKVRGQVFQEPGIAGGAPVLPIYSPFYAQRQPENEAAFIADLETASRIYQADYDMDASAIDYKHDYQWCYDLDFLIKMKPKRLSVDVETVGLIPFDPETKLLTVQFTWAEGKSIVVPIEYDRGELRHHKFIPWETINRKKLLRQVRQLLTNPDIEVFGQNFKFDWMMLHYQLGIKVANYSDDTMLLAHLYDENQRRINIDDLIRQHVPEMAGFNDQLNNDTDHHGKSRMDLLPPDKFLIYAGGDTDAAWRLEKVLQQKIRQDVGRHASLIDTYTHVTMPAQRAFCHIELNGFPVSKKELVSFERKLKQIQKRERIYLLRQIPKSIKNKWEDSGVGLKVTRGAILRDWLYTHKDGLRLKPVLYTKTKEPSISSKQALPYYVADHPVISRLIDYIKNDKLLNTYAKGFHKYIYGGLIRPSYGLTGTVTGRCQTYDTKVTTTKGVIPLGELVERFEAGEEFSVVTHRNRFQKVYNVFRNGRKPVYEVTLSNGAKTKATANHPLMTNDGWVTVDKLNVGDKLQVLPQTLYGEIEEDWRIVDGWEDYQVSNLGRVRYSGYKTTKAYRIVKPHRKGKWGHVKVKLSDRKNGRTLDAPVHRLVCEAFNGAAPAPHYEVMHLDGLPANNDYRNLAWGTSQENSDLMKQQGRSRIGERSNQAVLSWDDVRGIRQTYANGRVSQTELAAQHRVSRRLIGMIVNRQRWTNDPTDYAEITSIRRIGSRQTFDISVEFDHSFIADGIASHNSMSRDPNGQNFPKRGKLAKEYRKIFKAPKGWVYVSLDLSQAELRIAAMMSGDGNMLQVYAEGGDIHRTTAAGVMGITVDEFLKLPKDVQDLKRFQAKAVNFGFLYGMWWVKFRSYAKTEYGIDFTEEEAKEIRELFFRTYPMLEVWHEDVQEFAAEKGMIRTYDGRIRHLPNVFSQDEGIAKQAMRQAINAPVQSIASDLGLMTLGRLLPFLQNNGYDEWLKPSGFIHDAIVCLVREDKVAHACAIVKHFMESNPLEEWFGWTPEIPIIADAEVGRTLAETHELKASMFMGKKNRHKTYTDLITELETGNEVKAANSRSTVKTKRRKLKIKRGIANAKREATNTPESGSHRVPKKTRSVTRRNQRRKPREDRAA